MRYETKLFGTFVVMLAVACNVAGCNLADLKKANEKVDLSNELFDEAKSLSKKGDDIKAAAAQEADPDARKQAGKKCKAKYEEAEDKLEEAIGEIETASKLGIAKEFSDYLGLKAKQLGKVGDAIGAHRRMCEELTKEPDNAKLQKLVESAKEALEEAEELSEKAEKIREDHPEKFRK